MRFTLTFLIGALATLASAQNAFNIPEGGLSMTVGVPTTLSWAPTTQGTVSLFLRSGPEVNLNPGILIACASPFSPYCSLSPPLSISAPLLPSLNITLMPRMLLMKSNRTAAIANSGTFTYTPAAADCVWGVWYTVEILSDPNPNIFNFSPRFVINMGSAAPTSAPAWTPTPTPTPAPTVAYAENVSFPSPELF